MANNQTLPLYMHHPSDFSHLFRTLCSYFSPLTFKLQSKISATNISTSPPPASRTPSGQASSSTLRRSSSSSSVITPTISSCPVCGKAVYIVEQIEVNGVKFHKRSVIGNSGELGKSFM